MKGLATVPPIEVLIVEDNPGDVFLMRLFLEESTISMNIMVAEDGHEAMTLLNTKGVKPDLVLLDINLPRVNGLEVLRRIRESHGKSLPVIVFTSSARPDDMATATLHDASYIKKPVDLDGFHQAIDDVVKAWIYPLTQREGEGVRGLKDETSMDLNKPFTPPENS